MFFKIVLSRERERRKRERERETTRTRTRRRRERGGERGGGERRRDRMEEGESVRQTGTETVAGPDKPRVGRETDGLKSKPEEHSYPQTKI